MFLSAARPENVHRVGGICVYSMCTYIHTGPVVFVCGLLGYGSSSFRLQCVCFVSEYGMDCRFDQGGGPGLTIRR